MTDHQPITGSIQAVRDCGTLLLVFLDADEGRAVPLPLGHRAFHWLLERPDELVGRRISYDGDRIRFLTGSAPDDRHEVPAWRTRGNAWGA